MMKPLHFYSSLVLATSFYLTGCNQSTPTEASKTNVETTTQSSTAKTTSTAESKAPTFESSLPADAPEYKVYTITSFEPYCFQDEYGNSTGFDIDIMRAVGEKSGFKTVFKTVPWEEVLPGLDKRDKADIVASAVIIKEDRKKKYDFSTPYMTSNFALSVSDKYKFKSFEEIIADPEVKYSLLEGSAVTKTLTDTLKVPATNISGVSTQFLAIEQIFLKKADATFEDETVLRYYGKDYEGLHIKPYTAEKVELGIAVRKGNTELLTKINEGLADIKADGTYDKIYTKWFGAKSAE